MTEKAKREDKRDLNSSLRLLAKSSMFILVAIILSKIFTYLFRIVVARQYGAEVYGLFSLSLMVIGWFIVFSDLGLNQGLLRYISLFRGKKKEKEIKFILNRSLKLVTIVSIIAGIVVFLLSGVIAEYVFKDMNLEIFLQIFSVAIPITVLSGLFLSLIRSYEKVITYSWIENIINNFVKILVLVILVLVGFQSSSVAISYVLGGASVLIISYYVSKKTWSALFNYKKDKMPAREEKKIFKELFSYSWPLIFFGLAFTIFGWVDSFFIGIFRSVEEVGWYNAALPIALLLTVSKDLFRNLFFPLITKEYGRGKKEVVRQLSQQVGKWSFIISFPLCILFIIFPGAFINVLFGPEFLEAANALRFLAIGAMFTTVFELSKELISMEGKSRLILYDVLIAALLNVILNWVLVPEYGIDGAGFATMVSLIFLNSLFLYQSWKHLRIVPIRRKMLRIFFITLIPLTLLLGIRELIVVNLFWLIMLALFFGLLYILLIFTTGCLDENDKMILQILRDKFMSHNKAYKS